MPLTLFIRFVFTLISLLLLGLALWLLWQWYQHDVYWTVDGHTHVLVASWPLWLGVALLGLSFFGGPVLSLLVARPDDDPSLARHHNGIFIAGRTNNRLYVETTGPSDGPTMILTHGWGMDSTIWYYAKREFSRDYRVITWDLPGLGQSEKDTTSLESLADNLAAVIKFAGTPAILVGHSIGGMTIQTLARRQPQLFGPTVTRVVLLNTTYTNPLKTMILPRLAQALRPLLELVFRLQIWLLPLVWISSWQSYLSGSAHLANRIAFGPRVTRSQLNHVTLLGTRNSPAVQARGVLAMFRWDAAGAMAGINIPVLVVGGNIDIVTKEEAGRAIASSTPLGRSATVDAANHMGLVDMSAAYHSVVRGFLADSTASADPNLVPARAS